MIQKIEDEFTKNSEELKVRLIDKLFVLVNGKTSQGVKDYNNTEIIAKGSKFTMKQLQELDYVNLNPGKWTTDKQKNDQIKELLNNFMTKF